MNKELQKIEEEQWRQKAACNDTALAKLFFSDDDADMSAAKNVCRNCDVIVECLEGAILRKESCGIWGGQIFVDGTIVAMKRRRGRPAKVGLKFHEPQIAIPNELKELIS